MRAFLALFETKVGLLIFDQGDFDLPVSEGNIIDGDGLCQGFPGWGGHDNVLNQGRILNVECHFEPSNVLYFSLRIAQEQKVEDKIFEYRQEVAIQPDFIVFWCFFFDAFEGDFFGEVDVLRDLRIHIELELENLFVFFLVGYFLVVSLLKQSLTFEH